MSEPFSAEATAEPPGWHATFIPGLQRSRLAQARQETGCCVRSSVAARGLGNLCFPSGEREPPVELTLC
jgi:hypothetical protein